MFMRLAGRYNEHLSNADVRCIDTIWPHEMLGRLTGSIKRDPYSHYTEQGRQFASAVNCNIMKSGLLADTDCFFGFTCSSLETLQLMRKEGVATILDQFDPGRVEDEIVICERERWPEWEPFSSPIPDEYFERINQEWNEATCILVNSEWSKKSLLIQGVQEDKIEILPLAYSTTPRNFAFNYDGKRPLRILWLGTVMLRKGIQYLMGAAREVGDLAEFRVVGPIQISQDIVASCPGNMKFYGAIPRLCVNEFYEWADAFVLPTLSDGFAITQLEAMSKSLPVIATTSCGDVVTDGVDGFIIPPSDAEAIAAAIYKLSGNADLLETMSKKCLEKITHFSPDNIVQNHLELIRKVSGVV